MLFNNQKENICNCILVFLFFIISFFLHNYSIFFFGCLSLSIILIVLRKEDAICKKNVYIALFIGMIFITMMYYANILEVGNSYYTGGSDDLYYEEFANRYNQLNTNFFDFSKNYNWDSKTSAQSALYIVIIAKIIDFGNLFGEYHTFLFKIYNLALFIFIIILCNKVMKKEFFFSDKVRGSVLLNMVLLPSIYFFCSYTFRDVTSSFLFFLVYYSAISIKNSFKLQKIFLWLLVACASIYCQMFVRVFVAYISIIILLLYSIKKIPKNFRFFSILIIISLIIIPFYKEFISIFDEGNKLLETYTDYRSTDNVPAIIQFFATVPLIPFGFILRLFYGFCIPNASFAYLFGDYNLLFGLLMTLVGIGTIYILLTLPHAIKGFLIFDNLSLMFVLSCLCFISTLTSRHLILMYPFYFFLVAKGKEKELKIEKNMYYLYCIIIITFYFINSICL